MKIFIQTREARSALGQLQIPVCRLQSPLQQWLSCEQKVVVSPELMQRQLLSAAQKREQQSPSTVQAPSSLTHATVAHSPSMHSLPPQETPQPPQLLGSSEMSEQMSPQASKPSTHCATGGPPSGCGVTPPHTSLQIAGVSPLVIESHVSALSAERHELALADENARHEMLAHSS